MITHDQMVRLHIAATKYFNATDNSEAMHMSDSLHWLLNASDEGIEAIIKFYEEGE